MSARDFLLSINSKVIKYGLDRTIKLLETCENPHDKLKSIQIVGTNGKGSTASMLANVLIENGYTVGLYTSPHLVNINERIRINHKPISNKFMDSFIYRYKEKFIEQQSSFFEIMTVMALKYFESHNVDLAILETGLGGRLDSVTAAKSEIIVYTPIDIDHISILGGSLKSIAHEKAGAISPSSKLIFSTEQHNIVYSILNEKAQSVNNKILYDNAHQNKWGFVAKHQSQNASLVYFTLQHLVDFYPLKLSFTDIPIALQQTFWPGRIQFLSKDPDVIFDVAHNNHGLQAFIVYFKAILSKYNVKYLVLGFEDGKQIKNSVQDLYEIFDYITITETSIKSSMSAELLLDYHTTQNSSIVIEKNPVEAIQQNLLKQTYNDVIVILGSHYFGPYIAGIFKNAFDIK